MLEQLTPRQQQILNLLSTEALTAKLIARRLGLSHRTVEEHLRRMRKRLGARNTHQLVVLQLRAQFTAQAAAEGKPTPVMACKTCGGFGFVRCAA